MKGKRLLATMLALLLVVSLLPMAALADDNSAETTITTTTKDIGTNNGIIENNTCTVENNNNVVETNGTQNGGAESGRIHSNNGTVGEEGNNASGNYGTIYINKSGGNVLINQEGGVVDLNLKGGTIETNKGIVGAQSQFGDAEPTSGNFGTVETNNGKVLINQAGGTVETNAKGGIVETNKNGGAIDTNYGLVGKQIGNQFVTDGDTGNFGNVQNNMNGGTVVNNGGGTVVNNNADGTVHNNGGKVGSNSGMVYNNTAGSVVKVNEVEGHVANNSTGPDDVGNKPKVEINFGTVDYGNPGGDDVKTYYGVHYEDESKNKVYINQFKADTEVSISDLKISRPGFKLAYCQAVEEYHRSDPNRFEDVTDHEIEVDGVDRTVATRNEDGSVRSFFIQAPTRLKLFWEKIVTAVAPAASNGPEAKPVKAAALPSTVAAEDVKVGTVVRVKGQLFRVIEMDDTSMTVVTMGKLSKKDMEDPMAFLAKYFTPEQLELLLGDPELISGALAEELFGGNTGHIVFKAARNLFA